MKKQRVRSSFSRFLRQLIFAHYELIPENLSEYLKIIQDVVFMERPGFHLNIGAE